MFRKITKYNQIKKKKKKKTEMSGASLPHWLELPISRTNFHGPEHVGTVEV